MGLVEAAMQGCCAVVFHKSGVLLWCCRHVRARVKNNHSYDVAYMEVEVWRSKWWMAFVM
jgi:hypothetical protein